jgi:hypothetical protein
MGRWADGCSARTGWFVECAVQCSVMLGMQCGRVLMIASMYTAGQIV